MIFARRRDPSSAIGAFWTAWPGLRARAERSFAAQEIDDDLVRDVSAQVNAIHPGLEWEFSKGRTAQHAFIVSAGGDASLRAVAHRWHRAAPPTDATWEYHGARQAEPEMFEAAFEAQAHRIELADLRYAYTLDEQRSEYDVVVHHPAFAAMPEPQRVQIAFLSLDWLLGELGVEIWIGSVYVSVTAPATAETPQRLAEAVAALADQFSDDHWAVLGSGPSAEIPRIATVRSPLKPARWPLLDTHVGVTVPFRRTGNGLPDRDSLAALREFEDRLQALLADAVLVAHETGEHVRTFHVYADAAAYAATPVEQLAATWREGKAKVRRAADPGWERLRHLMP